MNNSSLFQLTQLAEASYADFTVSVDRQVNALQAKAFSETKATDLLANRTVISHQKNTETGFSAILFHAKDSNNPNQYETIDIMGCAA